jgi:uncharacterized protein with ParB-like and HNH nuclease domain
VSELLEDIDKVGESTDICVYIGTIYIREEKINDLTERTVIDGQQRLLSIFLLLIAIKTN